MDQDPTTEELRIAQTRREEAERDVADRTDSEDETEQHERRANKAAYLREKLEERAKAERESDRDPRRP